MLAVVFLAPTVRLPYLGDDVFNADLDGWLGYERLPAGDALWRFFALTNAEAGRFYPFWSLLTFSEFHLVHGVVALKYLVIAGILVNMLTFYVLLRALAPAAALPALAVLPLTWQLRFFQDPILQSSLHMQLALEFVLLAALFGSRYLREAKPPALWAGVASYACACLTYEPMYALAPAFAALLWTLPGGARRDRVVATLGYAVPPLVLAAATFALRSTHPVQAHSQHDLNLALQPFAATFGLNALGAIPLSYYLFDPGRFFAPAPQLWAHVLTSAAGVAVLVLAFATMFWALPRRAGGTLPRPLLAFCAALWVLCGTLISLSPLWQEQLAPGQAYATGYLADFAVAGIAGSLAMRLAAALPAALGRSLIAACVALVTLTTYAANEVATARYAPYWNMTLPYAFQAGLLAAAPPDATVYLDASYPAQTRFTSDTWHAKYFLYRRTGRRYDARPLSELQTGGRGAYVVRGEASGFTSGVAVAGSAVSVEAGADGAAVPLVEHATIYRRNEGAPALLSQWSSTCGGVPLDNVLAQMPTATMLVYGDGFYEREGDAGATWRWASRSAYVAAFNPTGRARLVRLSFSVRPVREATLSVVAGALRIARRTAADLPVSATLRVPAHAGARVSVVSDGVPLTHPPDRRPVLFEVRDARLTEAACR